MVKLLNGVRKNMAPLKKIDNAAIMYNKTKDPKYKNLWYKLVREFANGPNNIKRWTVPVNSSDKTDNGRNNITRSTSTKLF